MKPSPHQRLFRIVSTIHIPSILHITHNILNAHISQHTTIPRKLLFSLTTSRRRKLKRTITQGAFQILSSCLHQQETLTATLLRRVHIPTFLPFKLIHIRPTDIPIPTFPTPSVQHPVTRSHTPPVVRLTINLPRPIIHQVFTIALR